MRGTKMIRMVVGFCLALMMMLPGTAWAAEEEISYTSYKAGAPAGGNYTISFRSQLETLAEAVNGGSPMKEHILN